MANGRKVMASRTAWIVMVVGLALIVHPMSAIQVAAQTDVCGDVDGNGVIAATDALMLLKKAVGQDVAPLACPVTGLPATGQVSCWDFQGLPVSCAATGHDGETQAGVALSYVDNGDGTITDQNTDLMWEKKSYDSSLHDWTSTYTWDKADAPNDIWTWVTKLNNTCANDETVDCTAGGDADCTGVGGMCGFANHRDWRIPNYKELLSILDLENVEPAVDPIFNTNCASGCTVTTCSCTSSSWYWASSSYAGYAIYAWLVYFKDGQVRFLHKGVNDSVRAVRGGS